MLKFEDAVGPQLRRLFPMRRKAAVDSAINLLRKLFLHRTTRLALEVCPVKELDVALRDLQCDWMQELDGDQLGLSAGTASPSFQSLFDAVNLLQLARFGMHSPLNSILQEVESEVGAEAASLQIVPSLLLLHSKFVEVLQGLLQFGADHEGGLPTKMLCCVEKHWSGVAVSEVENVFRDLTFTSSSLSNDYVRAARRIEAILLGRQTALFWRHCREVQVAMCGAIQSGFPESWLQQEGSLQSLHDAFLRVPDDEEVALSQEDWDEVQDAVERTQELFAGLSQRQRGEGFDMVHRLVRAMASVPGRAFFGLLAESANKKEQLGTRLAELVEGALTPETLDTVEQAAVFFMPLCIGALRVMDQDVDSRRFQQTVATYWSKAVQEGALQTRSIYGLGELAFRMLKEAHSRFGAKLPEILDSLHPALRQGLVVQHKLQENDDDATAVSNTVHGLISSGQLVLKASEDSQSLEITAFFDFNGQQICRDMHQLTECADKARLTMPQSGGKNDSEQVHIFTSCVERAIGLRQELVELLQTGHPHNRGGQTSRFPSSGEGLTRITLRELDDRLKWARDAVMQWHDALECVRAECRLMSCVPARNVVKLAEAIIEGELTRLSSLVSVAIHAPSVLPGTGYQHLEDLFAESQRHVPEDGAHVRFLSELAKCLKAFVEEDAVAQLPLLHQVARRYPQRRSADDATQKSRISRRLNAQIHPRRVLLIQEEESHEKAGSPIQSTASVTLLSAMLSLGVGPGPENVLHCDATTTKDDVLRFLHSVSHATRFARANGLQSEVVGVCVQVDRLALDVWQVLLNRVDTLYAAAGRRRESGGGADVEVRLVFTLTRHAPKAMIDTLEKDLCKKQLIKILTHATLRRTLSEAGKCLCWHTVVSSDVSGNGKTHHIMNHTEWDRLSNASLVWGGAQSRGQAALELKKAIASGAHCLHLELHPFEEGGGVNVDLLVAELLLFGSVYDPSTSEWARLSSGTRLFVEVANSIKVRPQASAPELIPLTLLSAPLLKLVPEQFCVSAEIPFQFGKADLDLASASLQARDFSLAGSALLVNDLRCSRLVGSTEEDVVFKQTAATVVSGHHAQLVQERAADVVEAAKEALRREHESQRAGGFAMPSKATITFLRFLAEWTQKVGKSTAQFRDCFRRDSQCGCRTRLSSSPARDDPNGGRCVPSLCCCRGAREANV